MYQVAYNTRGPEKDRNGEFCIAGMSCKKCHWFVKKSMGSFEVFGERKTLRSSICNFNKKPYPDMKHKLVLYKEM
ncbi:MAG: hypothetical protein LBC27_05745 [Spirochaetaceae bacterium]|jgi:hypothetical protein|nr:hypothetical protein [Spirochaetaceae bacterium]